MPSPFPPAAPGALPYAIYLVPFSLFFGPKHPLPRFPPPPPLVLHSLSVCVACRRAQAAVRLEMKEISFQETSKTFRGPAEHFPAFHWCSLSFACVLSLFLFRYTRACARVCACSFTLLHPHVCVRAKHTCASYTHVRARTHANSRRYLNTQHTLHFPASIYVGI